MGRTWVIVAFGDILGFGTWRRRAATQPEISGPFLQKFYDEIQAFNKNFPHFYLKYLGDGLMLIMELSAGENSKRCAEVIGQIGLLNARLLKAVRECPFPAPEGFRMRMAAGHVDKIMVVDPLDRHREVPEFVGYSINLAQRLLEISPSTPFLCHESVLNVLGNKKKNFKVRKLESPTEKPRGIDSEDINGLWIVEF